MKRAEMIKIIKTTLEDINLENYFDEKGSEWCANLLLMEIEENGMLPPFNESTEESKVGYGAAYLSDEEVRLSYIRHFCKWEPEGETCQKK